ncbi:hypothetical protein [Planomonospora sp. ID82291]|uniref:hypothetical protein n=1 Tax=Planomonospora sp. ID82291 TaxID=2738136 RepID=UPI0018C3F037|nr:hypothetical protein [Planomonospora sp. ID82291]MBG0814066.1 hypothetical protein [Planomonospora sp. ID82291]
MSVIALVGVALDLHGGTGPDAFHWAFAVQYPFWLLGAVQVLRYRAITRRLLAAQSS